MTQQEKTVCHLIILCKYYKLSTGYILGLRGMCSVGPHLQRITDVEYLQKMQILREATIFTIINNTYRVDLLVSK